MNELQTTLEALRILFARSLCFGFSLGKKNRHRERVPLRTERRHVGQLFEDH